MDIEHIVTNTSIRLNRRRLSDIAELIYTIQNDQSRIVVSNHMINDSDYDILMSNKVGNITVSIDSDILNIFMPSLTNSRTLQELISLKNKFNMVFSYNNILSRIRHNPNTEVLNYMIRYRSSHIGHNDLQLLLFNYSLTSIGNNKLESLDNISLYGFNLPKDTLLDVVAKSTLGFSCDCYNYNRSISSSLMSACLERAIQYDSDRVLWVINNFYPTDLCNNLTINLSVSRCSNISNNVKIAVYIALPVYDVKTIASYLCSLKDDGDRAYVLSLLSVMIKYGLINELKYSIIRSTVRNISPSMVDTLDVIYNENIKSYEKYINVLR